MQQQTLSAQIAEAQTLSPMESTAHCHPLSKVSIRVTNEAIKATNTGYFSKCSPSPRSIKPASLRQGTAIKKVIVAQSCLTLCDPMDCSPPSFSIHGTFQERILAMVAISSSRDLPDLGIEHTCPALQADSLPSEPHLCCQINLLLKPSTAHMAALGVDLIALQWPGHR